MCPRGRLFCDQDWPAAQDGAKKKELQVLGVRERQQRLKGEPLDRCDTDRKRGAWAVARGTGTHKMREKKNQPFKKISLH